MIKRLSHVAPLQFGIVSAVMYGLLSLIFVPFFLIFALIGMHAAPANTQAMPGMLGGGMVVMAVLLPIFYAVLGFVFGVIAAFVYNLVAGWTGGFELTFSDVVPALPTEAIQRGEM